jgi:ribosomal protein L3
MKGILGRKVGMTQLLTERGVIVPVTVIEAGPCYVTQIKTAEKDGYTAIQLGYQETKPRRLTKGEVGHLRRRNANIPALRILREFRLKDISEYNLGQKVQAAPRRAVAFRAASSATTSAAAPARTASPTVCARRVPTARVPRQVGCTRASTWPGTWATSR